MGGLTLRSSCQVDAGLIGAMTFSIMTLNITTLSITAFSTILCIHDSLHKGTLSITIKGAAFCINNNQHDGARYNNTQPNNKGTTLSIKILSITKL